MATITWLHLSDLHFREGEQHKWDENIVLRHLLEDVAECMKKDSLVPDFIALSGDVAFSGKAEEYKLAAEFLTELLDKTGVRKECLLIVPGNHDVDRQRVSGWQASVWPTSWTAWRRTPSIWLI